jgi:hypothetical protein
MGYMSCGQHSWICDRQRKSEPHGHLRRCCRTNKEQQPIHPSAALKQVPGEQFPRKTGKLPLASILHHVSRWGFHLNRNRECRAGIPTCLTSACSSAVFCQVSLPQPVALQQADVILKRGLRWRRCENHRADFRAGRDKNPNRLQHPTSSRSTRQITPSSHHRIWFSQET